MKVFRALLAAACVLGFSSIASADSFTLWNINNLTLSGGGLTSVATGSFTFDDTTDTVASWNITVSGVPSANKYDYHYTSSPSDSSFVVYASGTVAFGGTEAPGFNPELTLSITSSLASSLGNQLLTDASMGSAEVGTTSTCDSSCELMVSSTDIKPSLTGVPLPEPTTLSLVGIAAIFGVRRFAAKRA